MLKWIWVVVAALSLAASPPSQADVCATALQIGKATFVADTCAPTLVAVPGLLEADLEKIWQHDANSCYAQGYAQVRELFDKPFNDGKPNVGMRCKLLAQTFDMPHTVWMKRYFLPVKKPFD
jgi:hypothetical protein